MPDRDLQDDTSCTSRTPCGSLSEIDILCASTGTDFEQNHQSLTGKIGTDSFSPKVMHHRECMPFLLKWDSFLTKIWNLRVKGGICQGHVDMKWCPGVDFSAGSLGMGLSSEWAAVAARLDGSVRNAYVMVGDGEIQEGGVWEARWLQPIMN